MILAAKALALLDGRYHVAAEDVRQVALPALNHRIIRNFHGEMERVTADAIVERVLAPRSERERPMLSADEARLLDRLTLGGGRRRPAPRGRACAARACAASASSSTTTATTSRATTRARSTGPSKRGCGSSSCASRAPTGTCSCTCSSTSARRWASARPTSCRARRSSRPRCATSPSQRRDAAGVATFDDTVAQLHRAGGRPGAALQGRSTRCARRPPAGRSSHQPGAVRLRRGGARARARRGDLGLLRGRRRRSTACGTCCIGG